MARAPRMDWACCRPAPSPRKCLIRQRIKAPRILRREQGEARFARYARTKWSGGPFRGPNARSTSDAPGAIALYFDAQHSPALRARAGQAFLIRFAHKKN